MPRGFAGLPRASMRLSHIRVGSQLQHGLPHLRTAQFRFGVPQIEQLQFFANEGIS